MDSTTDNEEEPDAQRSRIDDVTRRDGVVGDDDSNE
jgi:hypothetical protein